MKAVDKKLQKISIEVKKLTLVSTEGELRYAPFSLVLSDSNPCCRVHGKSGSGKTTFFKSLIRRFVEDWHEYENIDADILVNRNELNFYKTNGRIGYAAQRPFFIAHHSVRYNLVEPFSWCGMPTPTTDRVDEVLRDFHIDRIVDRKAYKLSAGEKQRLNLARMFIANPELAIIDECLSSMDEELAESIASVIVNKYAKSSRILVTGHRKQDLAMFLHGTLEFNYEDSSESKLVREVRVTYNDGTP